jgi:biotin carboxyl carrier protein
MTLLYSPQLMMQASLSREIYYLKHNLGFLEGLGAFSQYLGFIGMLSGITSSLIEISTQQQMDWENFAREIPGSLVVAIMGLALAALIKFGHHRLSEKVYLAEGKIQCFIYEFSAILLRNVPDALAPQPDKSDQSASVDSGTISKPRFESTAKRLIEVRLPDMGPRKLASIHGIFVKTGDTVELDQLLFKLGFGEHSMEVRSSASGNVLELTVELGQVVQENTLLLVLEGLVSTHSPMSASAAKASDTTPAPAPALAQAPAPVPSPAAAGSLVEVPVPDIGDFKDVAVIEIFVKPGDRVAVDQSLITVESDKASMEIPSSAAGVVRELKVKIGDKVAEGSLLLVLEVDDHAAMVTSAHEATSPVPIGRIQPHTDKVVLDWKPASARLTQ